MRRFASHFLTINHHPPLSKKVDLFLKIDTFGISGFIRDQSQEIEMARHSHSHSHSHSPSSPQSPLNSSSNLNASTSTSSYNPHPTLSNSTLSPASLTPAQPTLSLAHARRSINNNQFSPNPSNSSPPSISHSSSTISNANSRKVSNQSQLEDPFANDKPDQGIDKDFHLHSDFSTNSENPGNVLVKVQGVQFYVHKELSIQERCSVF